MNAYNKNEPKAFGNAVAALVVGLLNGFGSEDIANLVAAASAAAPAMDELQGDTDAALFHMFAGIAEGVGDSRQNPPA